MGVSDDTLIGDSAGPARFLARGGMSIGMTLVDQEEGKEVQLITKI